jgi:hypothetical protein
MKYIVDLCRANVIRAKDSAFIPLRLRRNSRKLCEVKSRHDGNMKNRNISKRNKKGK